LKVGLLLKKSALSKDCYFTIDSDFGSNANRKWNTPLTREHQEQ